MGKKSVREIKRASARKSREKLREVIGACLAKERAFWRRVAELLARPRRKKVVVNVSKVQRYAEDGKIVVVPGKLLGDGKITKSVVVAAFDASESAKKKLEEAGGKLISILDALKEDVKKLKIVI